MPSKRKYKFLRILWKDEFRRRCSRKLHGISTKFFDIQQGNAFPVLDFISNMRIASSLPNLDTSSHFFHFVRWRYRYGFLEAEEFEN